MNSRLPNQITVEREIGEERVAIWKKNGKSRLPNQITVDPYLARQLSVFSPWGVTPTSEFVCVVPFPDGDAKIHTKIYPGSGKRRPYVQRRERVCIILHLSACTGVNTSVVWSKVKILLRMRVALRDVLPPVFAPGPPLL